MSVASMAVSEFRVGEVLSRSMAILGRNIIPFGLLALVFAAPEFVLNVMVDPQSGLSDPKTVQAMEYGDPEAIRSFYFLIAAMVGLALLGIFLNSLATGAMVFGTFQDLRGTPARIGTSVARGVGAVFPIIGVVLLSLLLMMLGGILFVFPAFMVMTAVWVAVPAAVVERPGVIASLKRSAALTKGYRWRVFGLFAVLWLLSAIAASVVQAPFLSAIMNAGPQGPDPGTWMTYNALLLIVSAFFTALSAVASTVAYHDLRAVKEGFDIDRYAAVFD